MAASPTFQRSPALCRQPVPSLAWGICPHRDTVPNHLLSASQQHLQPGRCHPQRGQLLTTLENPQNTSAHSSSSKKRSFMACSKTLRMSPWQDTPAKLCQYSHSHQR